MVQIPLSPSSLPPPSMEYLSLQQTHSRYVSEETLQASSSRETLRHHQQSETDSEGTKQRQSGNAQQSELEQMELEQRLLEEEIWSPRKPEATDKVPVTEDTKVDMTTTFINVIGRALAGNLQAVAILSHVLMLAFYMILFALYFCHIPIGSPFDEKRQVTVDTWLTVALQCFGVTQTTIMLFSVQQFAMRSILMTRTTVTELHDVAQSWAGLGSAISNLYQQIKVPSTMSAPLVALLYLSGIAGLHITTPALFGVEVFTSNASVPVMTRGLINWTEASRDFEKEHDGYAHVGQILLSSIQAIYGDHSDLSNNSQLLGSSVGLYGGSVYAIPDDNEGTGTIWVNATYFGVQCGEAGDAFQVHNGSDHMGYDKTVPQFSIADFNGDGEGFPGWVFGDSDFEYPVFAEHSLKVFKISHWWPRPPLKPSHVFYLVSCVTDILDSLSQKGNTSFVIEPALKYNVLLDWQAEGSGGTANWQVGEIQVLQCIFKPKQWLLEVDATTKLVRPGTASNPLSDLEAKARQFEVMNPHGEYPYRPYEGTDFEDDINLLKAMFDIAPSIQNPQLTYVDEYANELPELAGVAFRTVDDHLMQLLNCTPAIFDTYHSNADKSCKELSLHKVEEALANTSAAMYWAELYLSSSIRLSPGSRRERPNRQEHLSTVLVPSKPMARVHLNIIPLATGFGLTLALTVLLVVILRHGTVSSNSIHDLGILDVIWMSRRYTEVEWEKIADAPIPSTEDLRRRGRGVEVDLSHLLRGEDHQSWLSDTERAQLRSRSSH